MGVDDLACLVEIRAPKMLFSGAPLQLDVAVGGHQLGFDEVGGAVPKASDRLPKPPSLMKPATLTVGSRHLHVASGLDHHVVIDAFPTCARFRLNQPAAPDPVPRNRI